MKKLEHKTKNEKRRLVMQKQNARKEKNMAMYGAENGAAVVVGKTVNFNRRIIAAFLALVFVITTLVGVNFLVRAEVDDDGFNMLEKTESGMVLRKGLKYDENSDTYSLKLEAYATAPSATKTYEADTPLDVVLVMDQSGSMINRDVLTSDYYELDAPSYTVEEAEALYYYDPEDNTYYPVQVDTSIEHTHLEIQGYGTSANPWTAVKADQWYTNNGNRNIYYYNPETQEYETVYTKRADWYKNAGTVRVDDLLDAGVFSFDSYFWTYNNKAVKAGYYYNSSGDINQNNPTWHLIYGNTRGVFLGGYYVFLWYYTGTGSSTLSYNCSASDYNQFVSDGYVKRVPNSPYQHGTYGDYDAWESSGTLSSDQNYTGGQLYKRVTVDPSDTSVPLNTIFTSENHTLAWPLAGGTNATSVQSSNYEGTLYSSGYRLYYVKDGETEPTYISDSVFNTTDTAYTVSETKPQLYTRYTTRLDAEKNGATNLAEQIAEAVSEDADHRIAVVGFNNTGSVASNLVSADSNAIATAVSGLSASGNSSVAAGLTTAQSIFANNTVDPADSRKRIVVVFTDDDTIESAANSAAQTLKDTYHASVYTIGYNKDGVSSTVGDWLDHLSSNYYASTETDDGIDYYKATNSKASILDAFNGIETSMEAPTTTATLGTANAVLKDIVSNNFDTTNMSIEPVKTSTGTWPTGGELSWGNPSTSSLSANRSGNTVSVSGFDYNANYVAEGHNGQKIILSINGLKLKDKAKAESDKRIYTNDANSGIYKTGDEDLLMAKFLRPYVDDISNMAPAGGSGITDSTSGAVVNKYLTPNDNGKYDLTLEAYTTMTNTTMVEKIPTDFVVVVDQSGSMSTEDMPTGYRPVSGGLTIEDVADGSYYVQAADGNYYRVYGTKDYLYRYYPANYWYTGDLADYIGARRGWFMGETEVEADYANMFYFQETLDGKNYYRPVSVTVRGVLLAYYMHFEYDSLLTNSKVSFDRDDTTYSSNGNAPWYKNVLNGNVMRSGALRWAADAAVQLLYPDDYQYTMSELNLGITTARTGMYVNYPMYSRNVGYTELRYRDVNGVEHTLAATNGETNWEFCNASGQAITTPDGTTRPTYTGLYEASGTTTRIAALKNALNDFAQAVAEETDSTGKVDNKIAIVGFSSNGYNNTELLTNNRQDFSISRGSYISGYGYNQNGVDKATADNNTDWYANALVDATNGTAGQVNDGITNAINALTPYGGTQPEDGLNMANQILANRSETKYAFQYGERARNHEEVDRNTIVIFFTDGQPGNYAYSNQYSEANDVVEAALPIKQSGATVFSIGVFGESDGNPLTYSHADAYSIDANWEYLGGWVENYNAGTTYNPHYYALRRQWRSGAEGYTPTANDTIYDYMSVTSSNYPTAADYIAPGWMSGNFDGTYTQATDGVRNGSTDTTVNNHYRMASNQDTLIAAFAQAVTMMSDTISDDIRLDSSAIIRDILKNGSFKTSNSTIVSTATVDGSMDKNGVVTFASESVPITLSQAPTYADGSLSSIDIKGFDYLANYINYGTQIGDQTIAQHDGKKLVVTITDVYPDGADAAPSGDTLVYSNQAPESALYGVNNGAETRVKPFPEPAIYRHSYKLNVGDINTAAAFDVSTAIVTSAGSTIDLDDDDVKDDLKDVMIVFPDGTRYNYLSVGPQVFRNMKDGDIFYFENIPAGYKVKTGVTTTDDSYVYHINFDGGTSKQMDVGVEESTNFTFDNHNINIISDRAMKNVTIWEQTIGSFSNPDQVFDEVVTMQIPVSAGTNIPQEFKYDATFTGSYHGYNNDTLPQNADSYKAVFTWDGENPVDGKVTATLTAIESTKGGTTYTYPTTNGLPMKHDDKITFSVPTGTTVTVAEPETHDHDVSLYTSKDDVAPENITFETMSGTPISGEYEMTFAPVDGINASSQTITFEDGVVTSTSNPVDFAPYLSLSFTTDEDIGYPYLNVNGKKIPFEVETTTEGGNTTYTYIAGLKQTTTAAPITTTVEKDHVDILVVNEKGDIPVEGIFDSSNHNWVIYILAALGGLAAIGAGIFLWKKKDEFVEE